MAYYVCSGATLKCSMGSQSSSLCVVYPIKPVRVEGNPVANLRKALILMGHEVEEAGPFDEPLFCAFLHYLRRFGRAEWDFVQEDKGDAEKSLDEVAARYGLATWKCFYGEECGDGEGGVEHERVMKKINSTYGDELLKEKGGVPHDYRSSLCYHYPWVPFSLTINRSEEEEASTEKDADKEVRYEIYDGKRYALVGEGEVVDDKIEDLFPDVEYPVIFVDGVRIWLNPEQPDVPFEEAVEEDDMTPRIVDAYWCYGEDQQRVTTDDSRHYVDLSLHIITENYNDGDTVRVNLRTGDTDSELMSVSGIVYDNKAVIENVFTDDFIL